jgi:hypothetical protein
VLALVVARRDALRRGQALANVGTPTRGGIESAKQLSIEQRVVEQGLHGHLLTLATNGMAERYVTLSFSPVPGIPRDHHLRRWIANWSGPRPTAWHGLRNGRSMTAMSPRRVAHPPADWRTRTNSSYVRAFTRAFFGLGKDQVTAMKIAERRQALSPTQPGRRQVWFAAGPESV